jgi:hypothetical protein
MDSVSEAALDRGQDSHRIEIADATLTFRSASIADLTPTGAQLAAAAGFKPAQQTTVLQILANGELEDVRPDETVNLRHANGRFVIIESDRSYRFTIDGVRFDWPCRVVSGGLLRKLGQVPTEKGILLEQSETADRSIGPHDLVDLDAAGAEAFVTRIKQWKLNVQGVLIEVGMPTIGVRDDGARGFNQGVAVPGAIGGFQSGDFLFHVVSFLVSIVDMLRYRPFVDNVKYFFTNSCGSSSDRQTTWR